MMITPKKILVAVDYSPTSERALRVALELAHEFPAQVEVLHVSATPYASEGLHGEAAVPQRAPDANSNNLYDLARASELQQMQSFLAPHQEKSTGLKFEYLIVSGDPREKVTEHARVSGCDWVVIGTHGRKALSRWFLGSVAEYTVRHAPCAVLTVPSPEPD